MAVVEIPQMLEYKGGQLNAAPDFQDSPDDEEDTRSSHEYLNDLEEEYQARSFLAKSKRFFKKEVVPLEVSPLAPQLRARMWLMKNEDHQVLRNKQKVEEDAFDCTRVDDDGVEFSPEGGDYFPIMGDETKKDNCSIFLLLLIICIVLMLIDRASYGANIKPNKAGSEEVADLNPDQLPTFAFVVLVSSIIPISNLSHKTFAHTLVLNVSEFNNMTKSSVPSGALFVLLS
nr:hypothetical protein [Tanacetum cinerariifolium]